MSDESDSRKKVSKPAVYPCVVVRDVVAGETKAKVRVKPSGKEAMQDDPVYRDTAVREATVEQHITKVQASVVVEVDIDRIINDVAFRAAGCKGGKAISLGGWVTARRVGAKVISERTEPVTIWPGYERVPGAPTRRVDPRGKWWKR
jgi:hypothetical protein